MYSGITRTPICALPDGSTYVEGFSRVIYKDVWPHIDVHFYGGGLGAKVAFVIRPGGVPETIQLAFVGQDSLGLDVLGALKLYSQGKWIELREAQAYQVDGNNTE